MLLQQLLEPFNLFLELARRFCVSAVLTVVAQIPKLFKKKSPPKREPTPATQAKPPPLCDYKISFFDDFRIINGVPVFAINPRKGRKNHGESVEGQSSGALGKSQSDTAGNRVTCCAISADGSRIASGHNDGSAMIWSTEHGTLLHELLEPTRLSVIPEIRFLESSNNIVLAADLHGRFMRWSVNDSTVEYGDCAHAWHEYDTCPPEWDDAMPSFKPIIHCPTFSKDARSLVFPVLHPYKGVITMDQWEVSCSCYCFDTRQTLVDKGVMELKFKVTTGHPGKDYQYSLLGNQSKGIFVGVASRTEGCLLAWPDAAGGDDPVELEGMLGCWSPQDDFIASWNIPIEGSLKKEAQECYISPTATKDSTVTLSDPEGGMVLRADFVPDLHGNLGIATCVFQNDTEIVLWELETMTILHRLQTGMIYDTPVDIPPWDDSWLGVHRSYRSRSISLSGNGRWLVVYCNEIRKGLVWDVRSGIEVLSFSVPDDIQGGKLVDVSFSERGDRFVVCGTETILVWQTNALGVHFPTADVSQLALRSADRLLSTGEVQCEFSWDGNMVGVCRVHSVWLTVWNLTNGVRQTLAVPRQEKLRKISEFPQKDVSELTEKDASVFRMFAFSRDGKRVAASMFHPSVHVWYLGGEKDLIAPDIEIELTMSLETRARGIGGKDLIGPAIQIGMTLSRETCAMCFSMDPNGNETIVLCQKNGSLVWLGVDDEEVVDKRKSGFGVRRARCSQDGKTGVLMENDYVVHMWDLVHRQQKRRVEFNMCLGPAGPLPFPHNISMDGSFAFVGIERGVDHLKPGTCFLTCRKETTELDLVNLHRVPRNVVMTDNPEWVVVDEFVELDSRTGMPGLPTKSPSGKKDAPDADSTKYPKVDYFHESKAFSYIINEESKQNEYSPTDSVTMLHVGGTLSPKVLRGKDLLPHKFITTSHDGRRVACLSKNGSVFIWTAFATRGSLPTWNDLEVFGESSDPEKMMDLLKEHRSALLNFPDHERKTIPQHVVIKRDYEILETLMSFAVKEGILVNLICDAPSSQQGKEPVTALGIALKSRALVCAEILLKYLPQGLTTPIATADIYGLSSKKLAKVFPSAFHKVLAHNLMLRNLPEIRVPESTFCDRSFKVMTSNMLEPSPALLEKMWSERLKIGPASYKKKIRAYPRVVLYPGIADVGTKGLLKQIALRQSKSDHSQMYSSLAIRALIRHKWIAYGRDILIEEISSYLFQWVAFTIFALVLGSVWNLVTLKDIASGQSKGISHEEMRKNMVAGVFLTVAWILSIFSLAREINYLIGVVAENKLRGLYYWMRSFWNWLDLSTHLLLVLCIGPLWLKIATSERSNRHLDEVVHLQGGTHEDHVQEGQKRLTAVVCLESILLSWKMLHFAQAFRWTAPMVLMINEILRSISVFLFITLGLVFGFAIAFFVLFRVEMRKPNAKHTDDFDEVHILFGNPGSSLLTAFGMMLGTTQLDKLAILDPIMRILGTIMFVVYLLASMVILLNLLIAVMGDSFDRVKSLEVQHFQKGRAQVITDMEYRMSKNRRKECGEKLDRYVHILLPDHRHGPQTWKGRMNEQNDFFEKSLRNMMSEMRGDLKDALEANRLIVPETFENNTGEMDQLFVHCEESDDLE